MSILLVLMVAYAAYAAYAVVPRLLVELVATFIAMWLVGADRRARTMLLKCACDEASTGSNRKPSQAETRALHRSLDTALNLTTFTSLLPHVAARARNRHSS